MTQEQSAKRLRLFLIRHGEVEGAEAGGVYGRTDVPLSEKGIEQSRRLADRLATARLSTVYSSDLVRAVNTAEMIAERHKLTVQTNPSWREIDMGQWDGMALKDLYGRRQVLATTQFH